MNVLNKLKSKKTKEPLRVTDEVVLEVKVETQTVSIKSVEKKEEVRPNTHIFSEKQSAPRINSERSKS